MKWLKEHKSLLASCLVFTIGLVLWLAFALQINIALAAPAGMAGGLGSRLSADYSQQDSPRLFRVINLAIVREALEDLRVPGDVDGAVDDFNASLEQGVATATAINFSGDPPPTATPTNTPTSTKTSTPTPTWTPEPTATNTWTPSPTPKPTEPTKTPKPSATPKTKTETPGDTKAPIINPGGELIITTDPVDLTLSAVDGTCSFTISVEQVYVEDPAVSSGLDWITIKYEVKDHTPHTLSAPLTLTCGGFDGDRWYSCHMGSVDVQIEEEWSDPATVTVWLYARDQAGKTTLYPVGDYLVTCTGD